MGNVIGGLFLGIGMLGMFAVWIYTTVVFFASGQTLLALISLVVPPADIVLPFLITPMLGFAGLGAMSLAFAGSAMRRD
jgi:hypothetical protein